MWGAGATGSRLVTGDTELHQPFESELADVFGIDLVPSAETADEIYDRIDAALTTDEFRPRELFDRFRIEFIATTDDPVDDLAHHQAIAASEEWSRAVVPTFRPDKYLEPLKPTWNADVDRLGEVAGVDTTTYKGYIAAMENRRAFFKANGAISTDHSHADAGAEKLSAVEAERLYAAARAGTISAADAVRLRRDFVFEQARMASEDGLVMTIHPAVARNHHEPTFERFGADVGTDFPIHVEFVNALKPMLNAFGTMGSVYAEKVMGRTAPKVALVNNGAEETKGTPIYREAHQLLKANPCIHFAGNIEPRYIMDGEVDVVVCDGFVGNVVLKLTEGVAKTLLGMLKKIFLQNLITKLSYLGIKGGLGELKRMMDSEEVGGAPLLGAAKPVIKAHGSSHAKGIKNAIRQAKLCVANDLCGTMQTALAAVAEKAEAEKAEPVKE